MAVLKINGVEVKAPATLNVTYNEISNAERNANGIMIKEHIATKVKLEMTWNAIRNDKLSELLVLTDGNTFNVTYYDPKVNNFITKNFYSGDRKTDALYFKNGKMYFKSVSMNFVEV